MVRCLCPSIVINLTFNIALSAVITKLNIIIIAINITNYIQFYSTCTMRGPICTLEACPPPGTKG